MPADEPANVTDARVARENAVAAFFTSLTSLAYDARAMLNDLWKHEMEERAAEQERLARHAQAGRSGAHV